MGYGSSGLPIGLQFVARPWEEEVLWRLGGEIIRDLNYDPSLRKLAAERLLRKVIHEDGGPLLYHGSEDEQRSFDSTCRKLHRFLSQPER